MCGRFTLTASPDTLQESFPEYKTPSKLTPHYNIAPSQPIVVIPNDGRNAVDFFVWGLVPFWAKDPSIGNRMINARSETLADKPSFRTPYKHRRCLILTDGFYEWAKQPNQRSKIPYYIKLKSGKPFAFAGLWDQWLSSDGSEIKSATIITTQPNELVANLHNRMPVILHPGNYKLWLDPGERKPKELQGLLRPYPAEEMIYYPVSTNVNNPANDVPECIVPLE